MGRTGSTRDYLADLNNILLNNILIVTVTTPEKEGPYVVDTSVLEVIDALLSGKPVMYNINNLYYLTNFRLLGDTLYMSYARLDGGTVEWRHTSDGFYLIELG